MQRRETDISWFLSAQPDIYICLKLMWHQRRCSLVKGQGGESARKDGWRSSVNCTEIIPFPSAATAAASSAVSSCQQLQPRGSKSHKHVKILILSIFSGVAPHPACLPLPLDISLLVLFDQEQDDFRRHPVRLQHRRSSSSRSSTDPI